MDVKEMGKWSNNTIHICIDRTRWRNKTTQPKLPVSSVNITNDQGTVCIVLAARPCKRARK